MRFYLLLSERALIRAQGVLLQIFTTPLSDRPTAFLEVIQRIGCMSEAESNGAAHVAAGSKGSAQPAGGVSVAPAPAAAKEAALEQAGRLRRLWQGQLLRTLQEHRGLRAQAGHQLSVGPVRDYPGRQVLQESDLDKRYSVDRRIGPRRLRTEHSEQRLFF